MGAVTMPCMYPGVSIGTSRPGHLWSSVGAPRSPQPFWSAAHREPPSREGWGRGLDSAQWLDIYFYNFDFIYSFKYSKNLFKFPKMCRNLRKMQDKFC
jgi:hypothetical protein